MRAKAVKGFERYDHRILTRSADLHDTVLERRGSTRVIELADEFYIRQATSSRGYRVIFKDTGPTIIYTISEFQATQLRSMSQRIEEFET